MLIQKIWIPVLISLVTLMSNTMLSKDRELNSSSGEIRIMTYNIRYDNSGDGINRWDMRKGRVVNLIKFNKAEIIGMQEALHHQVAWLDEALPEYGWVGVGRDDGKQKGEYSPIFYNADRFELLVHSSFWLSPTPEKPSKGWDAALPRICTAARFRDRRTQKEFMVFNTHFDHRGQQARKQSARLILQKINALSGDEIPVILTGDFNAVPESEPYSIISQSMDDAFHATLLLHYGPESTYLDQGGGFFVGEGKGGRRIDYIFTNPEIKVLRHGIISSFRDGRFPSDHLPVVADLLFQD